MVRNLIIGSGVTGEREGRTVSRRPQSRARASEAEAGLAASRRRWQRHSRTVARALGQVASIGQVACSAHAQCSLATAYVPVEKPEQVKLSRSSRRPEATVPAGQRPAAQCYMLSRASSIHGRPSMEAKTTQNRPRRRSTGGATWLITRNGLRRKVHNLRNYDVMTANQNSKKFGKFSKSRECSI